MDRERIENTVYALGCSKEMAIDVLEEIDRQKGIAIRDVINKLKKCSYTYDDGVKYYLGYEIEDIIKEFVKGQKSEVHDGN